MYWETQLQRREINTFQINIIMKKTLFSITIIILGFLNLCSQPMMQASLGYGSNSNRIKVYIKPDASVSGTISTLQFDVALDATVSPAPTLTMIGTPSFGLTWFIDPSYIESGYRHYQLTTAISPFINIPASDTMVFELEFSGGPIGSFPIYLITLTEGGSTGNALYLCTGAANSVSGQLYYPRTGVTVVNNDSYNSGGGISYAVINGISLPAEISEFLATKENKDGVLFWKVETTTNINGFEVERSFDGINFKKILFENYKSNQNIYTCRDENIDANKTSYVYYRLKTIDQDDNFNYSQVRVLKTDNKPIAISLFPNPTTDYIQIRSSELSIFKEVFLTNNIGQIIQTFDLTSNIGLNYTIYLNNLNLTSGIYTLHITDINKHSYFEKFVYLKNE